MSTMANVDTGSAANDAFGDDLSLGDEVLNSSKEYDNIGEEVFTKIESLPNAALVSETSSNDHVCNHIVCHHLDEDAVIDFAARSPARKKIMSNPSFMVTGMQKSVIILNIDVEHGGKSVVLCSCHASQMTHHLASISVSLTSM